MSQANVEIVRRGYAACIRGDVDAAVALTHPSAELRTPGRLPDVGEVSGRDAVRRWFEQLFDVYEMRFEAERIIDGGETTVVATGKLTVRGKGSGAKGVNQQTHVWQVSDGMLAGLEVYATEAEALEAVGLSE